MKISIGAWAALLLGASAHPASAVPAVTTPVAPTTISTLKAVSLTGESVDIAAQKGWRVVYFWSEDCPCVRDCERLSLIHLAAKYKDKVAFYAVESNAPDMSGNRQALEANIAIHHLPFPVLLDPGHAAADALGAVATPQTFVLDSENKVVYQGPPDDSPEYKARTGRPGVTHAYLADALAQALAGQPVQHPVIKSLGCGIVR